MGPGILLQMPFSRTGKCDFYFLIACSMACKAYSNNKIIVNVATGYIKCGLGSPGKMYLSPGKALEICS